MVEILKIICLGLILLNTPTFGLYAFGDTIGGLFSLLVFGLPIVYGVLAKRLLVSKIFLLIGLSYYLVSGIQFYHGDEKFYVNDLIKFLTLIVFGGELVRNTTKTELFVFLLIGSSIIVNAIFFADNFGRYSGLYLDPNAAGFICISGYGLTYGLNKGNLRLFGQFLFSLAGFMTFSRTFIILWVLLNIMSLKLSLKNLKVMFIGIAVVILLISFSEALQLNSVRLNQLKALVTNEKVSTRELNEGSRTETWATFYKYVYDKPLFGNGYGSFQTNGLNRVGPHNTFLLVLGEAGIFVLFIFLGFYLYILFKSTLLFSIKPHLLMMSVGLVLFLLTNHNYFTAYYLILISIWTYWQLKITAYED